MNDNKEMLTLGIPFRVGRKTPLLIVKATVNQKGPFNFVVDTGASHTIVSPEVARLAGLERKGVRAKALGAGGGLDARITRISSLRLGDIEEKNLQVAIMSLAPLNRGTRLGLGGIIGYNLLKRYRIIIDYSLKRILFKSPDLRPGARRR